VSRGKSGFPIPGQPTLIKVANGLPLHR